MLPVPQQPACLAPLADRGYPANGEENGHEAVLRERPPRVGDLLEEVPQRRGVLQGRSRDPGRRHHRQGHGPHRPARRRHLGRLPPGPPREPPDPGRGRRVREARHEPRLLPAARLGRGVPRAAGRPRAGRQALQGGHARGDRAVDRDGRGQTRRHRDPRGRLPGQRRHVRDRRPARRRAGGGDRRRGAPDRPRRLHHGLDGVDEPHPVAHLPRGRGTGAGAADRAGAPGRRRPEEDDLQLPRAAVRLPAGHRAGAEGVPLLRVGRLGPATGRLDVGAGGDQELPAPAVAARAHPREQGRGTAGVDAGPEPWELLRGGQPAGGDRGRRPEEAKGQELPAGERLTAVPSEGVLMAAIPEAPTLFLRKATGLVKGWSKFDAFLYSFMSVNFVTLGLFFSLSVLGFVPTGQILSALVITGVFMTFLVITYAGLISVMPRAGGDYVWQSRVLGGGIAFVLAVTGWWFILWYWAPVYANILNVEVFQPLAALFELNGVTDFLASNNGLFVVCLITVALAGLLVSLGMEVYAKVQKFCFYLGIAALALVFLVMLFGSRSGFQSAFNQESSNLFGASGDTYAKTLQLAGGAKVVPDLGFSPLFGGSLLLIPFLAFWILYPNWGATLYGEVRGASDFRRVTSGMMWGLWITIAIAVAFVLLAAKFFGWQFFNAANLAYWNVVYGTGQAAIPIWSYPPLLASFMFHNTLLSAIIVLVFGAWFLWWAGTLFLSSTRVIFAAAFDRILPERVADVSGRRHVPVWALLLMLVPSVVVSALYAYTTNFRTYVLDAVLVIAVTFFGTSIAAILLPWRKKRLYEASPLARYKVAGIPLISIAGTITALFLGWNLWKWFADSLYAVNNKTSLWFMGGMYLLALVIYVVAKVYRGRQGIDLNAIHQEIPVE